MITDIMVNGERFFVPREWVSYDDIAILACRPGENDLTITYTRPPENNRGISGTLRHGHSIDIEPKMVFDVVRTGAAWALGERSIPTVAVIVIRLLIAGKISPEDIEAVQ